MFSTDDVPTRLHTGANPFGKKDGGGIGKSRTATSVWPDWFTREPTKEKMIPNRLKEAKEILHLEPENGFGREDCDSVRRELDGNLDDGNIVADWPKNA